MAPKPPSPSFTLTGTGILTVTGQPPVNCTFTIVGNPAPTPALQITTVALPAGQVGTPYSAALQATGGTAPYLWSLLSGSLPTGLTVGSGGTITGTPTTSGSPTLVVQVQDALGATQSRSLPLSIVAAPDLLILTPPTLPGATAGQPYSTTLQGQGGTPGYSWAVVSGALPTGLTLNATTGAISGTPTTGGPFTAVIRLTDGIGTTTQQTFTLAVIALPAPLQVTPPPNQTAQTFGTTAPVSYPPATTTGGTAPITLTYSVPSGSSFPVGTTTVLVTAHSADNQTATATFTVTVQAIALPHVLSLSRLDPTPATGSPVHWALTFSAPVTGVTLGAFSLQAVGPTGAALLSLAGVGASYTITADLGSGAGTLGLSLSTIGGIVDSQGHPLSGPFTGEIYTVAAAGTGTPLSRNEHPRTIFTLADRPILGSRLGPGGEAHSDLQTAVGAVETYWTLDPSTIEINRLARLAAWAGYLYQLFPFCTGISFTKGTTAAAWGSQGVIWLLATLAKDPALGQAFFAASRSTVWAMDLLWPVLTPAQRAQCLTWVKQIDQEGHVQQVLNGSVSAALAAQQNWGNNQFCEAWALKIMAGLIFAGAGIDDAWASASYGYYTTMTRGPWGWVTKNSERGGSDGSWIQGNGYGLTYDQFPFIALERSWRMANGIDPTAHYPSSGVGSFIQGYPIIAQYHLRPYAEPYAFGPHGVAPKALRDTHTSWYGDWNYAGYDAAAGFALIGAELATVDAVRADLARFQAKELHFEGNDPEWWLFTRMLGPTGNPRPASTLGLATSRQLLPGEGHWLSGHVDATAWNHAHVVMKWQKFNADRPIVGDVQLDYLGPAIVHPGVGGHDDDAIQAHGFSNIVGAVEQGKAAAIHLNDDYGYHRTFHPNNDMDAGSLNDFNDLSTVRFLGVGAESAAERLGYAFVDQIRTVNSDTVNDQAITGNLPKFTVKTRQIAVILPQIPGTDPLRVWIYDRHTTKSHSPAYEHRNTFYLSGQPTVDGSPAAGPSRGSSGTDGKTTYSGASLVTWAATANGMHNRTWLRCLCPTPCQIVVVNWRRGDQTRYLEDSYGVLSLLGAGMGGDDASILPYASAYRIEIIPTTINLSESFLTGIVVGPTGSSEPPRTPISGSGFTGEQIGDTIVVFGTSDATTAGSIVLPAGFTGRLILCNLALSAARSASSGGSISQLLRVRDGGNALSTPTTATAAGTIEWSVVVGSGTTLQRTLTVS